MRAVGSWLQVDHGDPAIDQPGVLARADATSSPAAARKQPIVGPSPAPLKPRSKGLSGRLRDLEGNGPSRLLLNHRRALAKHAPWRHVADPKFDQVAGAELRIECAVKHREIPDPPERFQLLADRPDMLGLQRRLRADQTSGVPRPLRRSE